MKYTVAVLSELFASEIVIAIIMIVAQWILHSFSGEWRGSQLTKIRSSFAKLDRKSVV